MVASLVERNPSSLVGVKAFEESIFGPFAMGVTRVRNGREHGRTKPSSLDGCPMFA
jgi:hypothetical protein